MRAENAGASTYNRSILACLVLTVLGVSIHTCIYREREGRVTAGRGLLRKMNKNELVVAVLGGSTSTGYGTRVPSKMAWPVIFGEALQRRINRTVRVHNFALSARTADYFSTCFSRFLQDGPFDIFLLEFAINGGNVTNLVDEILVQSPNSKIILVKQLSCRPHNGSIHIPPILSLYVNSALMQTTAAWERALVELDFVNYLTSIYGNPCLRKNQDLLFDDREELFEYAPGRHHLGDFGSRLLGQFVADRVGQLLTEEKHTSQFFNTSHEISEMILKLPHGTQSCLFAGLQRRCIPNTNGTCSIRDGFTSNGWMFDSSLGRTDTIQREDKVCWITDRINATLRLPWKVSFNAITIFAEFSKFSYGQIGIFCGTRLIQHVDLHWPNPWTLIERKVVHGNCTNEILVIQNHKNQAAKICGIVF